MIATLPLEDAREIVRLLGEVCALPDDHAGKKHHLLLPGSSMAMGAISTSDSFLNPARRLRP